MHFQVIPNNRENPPSPNERLSKGYRIGDIKASAHASHKTHACISLKQRNYSHNYGLVYNLGKQMAVLSDIRGNVLVVLIFAGKELEAINGTSSLSDNASKNIKLKTLENLTQKFFSTRIFCVFKEFFWISMFNNKTSISKIYMICHLTSKSHFMGY